MDKSDKIVQLLNEGKNSCEIITMGYKKGTVYSTQRKWRQRNVKPTHRVNEVTTGRITSNQRSITESIDIESDPEIVQLKKEIRMAELNRQLAKAKAPSEVETLVTSAQEIGQKRCESCDYEDNGLCTFWKWSTASEIPSGIGEPVLEKKDVWRMKPTSLYCAMCTISVENDIDELEDALVKVPFRDIQDRFTCECETKGMLAFSIKCTMCRKETWWGWWPKEE